MMPHPQKQEEDHSLEISFRQPQPQLLIRKDQQLQVEILRVQAIQKSRIAQPLWGLSQNQLCDFFMQYELFPQEYFSFAGLLDSPRLKMVKSEGKIYFGEVDRKQRHGWGVQIDKSGHIYEGQFHSNEKRGKGI